MVQEYNKAVEKYRTVGKSERPKWTRDIRDMERAAAREGKTFVPVEGGAKWELRETGPSKTELQRQYARRFNDTKRYSDGTTDRERVAKRLGIAKPAGEVLR